MVRWIVVVGLVAGIVMGENKNLRTGSESTSVVWKDTLQKDPDTGLIMDKNLMIVKAQCTSCHSPMLISQNRFTRDGWRQKIRWMQANHNLWDLGDTEPLVLDYLEKHYAPTQGYSRRAPLKNTEWYPLKLD